MIFDKFNGFAIDNRSNLKKGGEKWGERESEEIESEKPEERRESEGKKERWEEKCVL